MKTLDINSIPSGGFGWLHILRWCNDNNIGNAKEEILRSNGYIRFIEMSDEEALLLYMKWGIKL